MFLFYGMGGDNYKNYNIKSCGLVFYEVLDIFCITEKFSVVCYIFNLLIFKMYDQIMN